MTKVKFKWEFKISEDQEDLMIMLNDGVNTLIEINHESFHKHLADKLFEIMYHQNVIGTKTKIEGMDEIVKATGLKK